MDSARDEGIGAHRTVGAGSADYSSSMQSQSHSLQQHHYQLQQQSDGRNTAEKSDENRSSPPHVLAATTNSTPTSTETGSSRSVAEGDNQHRPNAATVSAISSPLPPATLGSSIQLHSIPTDPSASWTQPQSPLLAPRVPGSPSDVAENDPLYDQGTPDSRYNSSAFPSAVKLLVSNNVAGSIIGRSGQTISDLQAQSGTRIKLSQAGDYFPGTQDRVCLVQGQGEHLKRAVNMLLTRLYALQQQQHYHHFAWQRQQQERGLMPHEPMFGVPDPMQAQVIPGFSFVVRILVPIPCCGMIIGKGGINVKQMVDNSGVSSVRLSPKEGGGPDAPPIYPAGQSPAAAAALVSATAERVVTITGPDLNSCLGCLHIILDGMTSHPDISRYANMTTSYTRVMAAAQDAFSGAQTVVTGAPTRRQLDQGVDSFLGGQQQPQQEGFAHTGTVERSPSHGYLDRLQQSPSLMQPADPMAQFVAFGGQSAPFLPQENSIRAPPIQPIQMQQNPVYVMPHGTTSPFPTGRSHDESMGMPPSHSAPDLLALQMQNTLRVSDHVVDANSAASFPGASSFSHQLPQPTHSPPGFAAQVAIADNVIGSILGRGGRTLNELQVLSNTRIRISQRGEYLPGTKNRVVTIRGPTSQSVSTAQYLMSQRMVLPPTASTYMDRPDYDNYGDYPPPTDQPPPC